MSGSNHIMVTRARSRARAAEIALAPVIHDQFTALPNDVLASIVEFAGAEALAVLSSINRWWASPDAPYLETPSLFTYNGRWTELNYFGSVSQEYAREWAFNQARGTLQVWAALQHDWRALFPIDLHLPANPVVESADHFVRQMEKVIMCTYTAADSDEEDGEIEVETDGSLPHFIKQLMCATTCTVSVTNNIIVNDAHVLMWLPTALSASLDSLGEWSWGHHGRYMSCIESLLWYKDDWDGDGDGARTRLTPIHAAMLNPNVRYITAGTYFAYEWKCVHRKAMQEKYERQGAVPKHVRDAEMNADHERLEAALEELKASSLRCEIAIDYYEWIDADERYVKHVERELMIAVVKSTRLRDVQFVAEQFMQACFDIHVREAWTKMLIDGVDVLDIAVKDDVFPQPYFRCRDVTIADYFATHAHPTTPDEGQEFFDSTNIHCVLFSADGQPPREGDYDSSVVDSDADSDVTRLWAAVIRAAMMIDSDDSDDSRDQPRRQRR